MKRFFPLTISLLLLFLCFSNVIWGQISICSWNVKKFGKSKTDTQLTMMAKILSQHHIIALQEINTAPDGAQQIANLVDLMNRNSAFKWFYNISESTSSDNPQERERYAYIWRKDKHIKTSKGMLDTAWQHSINREPFLKQFSYKEKPFTLINFHAVPKKKQPAQEIAHFKQYPQRINQAFMLLGDFNLPTSDMVWNPLKKQGFCIYPQQQKTTLRQKCLSDGCLANDYDYFVLSDNDFKILDSGAIPFHELYELDMATARRLSDHLPVYIEIDL